VQEWKKNGGNLTL